MRTCIHHAMSAGGLEAQPEGLEHAREVLKRDCMRSREKVVKQYREDVVEARVLLADEEVVACLSGFL